MTPKSIQACKKCGLDKYLNCFGYTKCKKGKEYLRKQCKSCRNALNVLLLSQKAKPKSIMSQEERRTRVNLQNKKWRQENPDKWKFYNRVNKHRRRALGKIDFDGWKEKCRQLNNLCQICFKTEPEVTITIDHILPVAKGGTNNLDNLQPLCMDCNRKKHAKYLLPIN